MSGFINIAVHSSRFPEAVQRELVRSLRSGEVDPKFHYDSLKQTRKWLALHEACSPARRDPDCMAAYDHSFATAVRGLSAASVQVFGLGCGGGQKEASLLRHLKEQGKTTFYTPCDASTAMALVAHRNALDVIPEAHCFPVVCDLSYPGALTELLEAKRIPGAARLITCFGLLPNFAPQVIFSGLAGISEEDALLLSANLAPGLDYTKGMLRILALYDNEMTRDWLMTFLLDLGVESADGEMGFKIETPASASGLKRVAAEFHFTRPRQVKIQQEAFEFESGDSLRLFYSFRYTPALVRNWLARHGLAVQDEWITSSSEEGVFLVKRER